VQEELKEVLAKIEKEVLRCYPRFWGIRSCSRCDIRGICSKLDVRLIGEEVR